MLRSLVDEKSTEETKVGIISTIATLKDPQSVTLLTDTLEDPSSDVKLAAIRALGQLGYGEGIDALIGMLSDSNRYIRLATVRALGAIQDPGIVAPLRAMLVDEERTIRRAALNVISQYEDPRVVDALALLVASKDAAERMEVDAEIQISHTPDNTKANLPRESVQVVEREGGLLVEFRKIDNLLVYALLEGESGFFLVTRYRDEDPRKYRRVSISEQVAVEWLGARMPEFEKIVFDQERVSDLEERLRAVEISGSKAPEDRSNDSEM